MNTKNSDPRLPGVARRTKIVCTLGPVSNSTEMIEKLIGAGMNVGRINCSHGDHEKHAETIANVRTVADKLGVHIPVFLDLAGPKMRISSFANNVVTLKTGDDFTLTSRDIEGDWKQVKIKYEALIIDISPGDRILMGDGEIELKVKSKTTTDVVCTVVVGGELKSNKGINAPGVKLRETVPTKKDLEDVEFGIKHQVDWFALSFVRDADEVRDLKAEIERRGEEIPVIVKIEKKEALDHIDDILEEADALMIARGDLGLEMPIEQVPLIQKDLIRLASRAQKTVITATQMLESMIDLPRPTRAEAADIANAVFDGTDAMMLSAETASGNYPVEAVRTMADIALASEDRIDYTKRFTQQTIHTDLSIPQAIAHAACHTAIQIDARVIICCTRSGQTAQYVSNYRPPVKIAVVSPHEETLNRTMLFWNTHPIRIQLAPETDDMIGKAKEAVLQSGIGVPGDRIVIVAGVPVDVPGTTNMIKADIL
jgi:pyruvate kinase